MKNSVYKFKTCILLLMLFLITPAAMADTYLQKLQALSNASLYMPGNNRFDHHEYQPDKHLVPASTLKLLTAKLAIDYWGLDHRFHTDFYLDTDNQLWIKAYGDPYLVSEEIEIIAMMLRRQGIHHISAIKIDDSFFARNIVIDGRTKTTNPYDAPVSALAANFNTVYLRRSNDMVESAEPQTELTNVSIYLANTLGNGRHRINIPDEPLCALHFAGLLSEKLKQQGVSVGNNIEFDYLSNEANLFYRHYNSHTLEHIVSAMLKVSNNFLANQLFLMLGADFLDAPATIQKAQIYAQEKVQNSFNWPGFVMKEGSGLSRKNRLTTRQLVELLESMKHYYYLLPRKQDGIYAKTGTLRGVSCYAGYINKEGMLAPFALLINHPVKHSFRGKVALALKNY